MPFRDDLEPLRERVRQLEAELAELARKRAHADARIAEREAKRQADDAGRLGREQTAYVHLRETPDPDVRFMNLGAVRWYVAPMFAPFGLLLATSNSDLTLRVLLPMIFVIPALFGLLWRNGLVVDRRSGVVQGTWGVVVPWFRTVVSAQPGDVEVRSREVDTDGGKNYKVTAVWVNDLRLVERRDRGGVETIADEVRSFLASSPITPA